MLKTYSERSPVKIKVVGLGGGGCNAITRMISEQINAVEFVAMNTDLQHLATTEALSRTAYCTDCKVIPTAALSYEGECNPLKRS